MTGLWSSPAILDALRRDELGTVIRLARKARGLTQAELGAACGYSQSVVSRIERGHRNAYDIRFLRRIADVLGVPSQLLRLAERMVQQPEPPDHRDFSTVTGTAPALLPTVASFADPTAEALRLVTAGQRQLGAWMPASDLAASVRRHLQLTGCSVRAARDEGTRAERAAALSEIAVSAGWLHWDMYDLGSARRHFDMAITAARESGDRLLTAYTTGYLAVFSSHQGDGVPSLGLVASARRQLGGDRPAVADAWLGGIAALGHAAAGDERSTLAALDHALAAAEEVPGEVPPPWPWISTIDTTRVAAYRLACAVRIRRPDLALSAAEEARPLLSGCTTQTALWRLDHAAAHLQAGDVDEAFSIATQVLATARRHRSTRVLERARALRRAYTAKSPPSEVLAFDEHARALGV